MIIYCYSSQIFFITFCTYMYARYSTCKAFKAMLCEVNDLAGQHEVIAENLQSDVIREINYLVKDIKEERKKVRPSIILLLYMD